MYNALHFTITPLTNGLQVRTVNAALLLQILPQERMFSLCDAIVQSGREYSVRQRSPVPLMYAYYDTEYLGELGGGGGWCDYRAD